MERLIEYFVPEKYVLNLSINKNEKTIEGTVKVSGLVKNEIIKFHAVDLKVSNVAINGAKKKFKTNGQELIIFEAPMGETDIEISYSGCLNENMEGAYLSTYEYEGETEVIVATQFESHYARQAFPCIDEPGAKAIFELTFTVPEGIGRAHV